MAFPFIILISALVFFLQNIQWIKTFTEAIASNRSDHWRQTAKVSVEFFKSQTCLEYPKKKPKADLQWAPSRACIPLAADFDGQKHIFFCCAPQLINESRRGNAKLPASRQRMVKKIETKSLGADWVCLPYMLSRSPTEGFYVKIMFMPNEPTSSSNKRKKKQHTETSDTVCLPV